MPSSRKTPFIGLNDWQASDHPLCSDFARDNGILDEFLRTFQPVPPLTAGRAIVSDVGGELATSAVTSIELAYLAGVTSAIQSQLDGKQASIQGAASTIAGSNLSANKAVISDNNGKIGISNVTASELAYLAGVTSAIQTQLDGKLAANGTAQDSAKVGGHTIYIQTAQPSAPALNDIWIEI